MPNYEYQCIQCEHRFEIWQSVGEAPPACPECGSEVKKIFHAPRVIFKGSGFYVTDLRAEKEAKKSSNGKSEKSEKSEASGSTSESSSTSDSSAKTEASPKTETKSETKTESAPVKSTTTDKK